MDEPDLSRKPRKGGYAQREARVLKPLTRARLDEMALSYVARFATSAAKLEAYLARKLRERGWDGAEDAASAVAAIVARCVEAGYVDDETYARMKSGSLLRRGYGQRRITQALGHDGIAADIREEVAPDPREARAAVVALARRKGLGPFTRGRDPDESLDPALREKQMGALLRAGHSSALARAILDMADRDMAESWVEEGD